MMLCDHGKLPQGDRTAEEQKKNPILQKFVLPLIRGWVRIEGSKYDARDYVSQQKEPPPAAQLAAAHGLLAPMPGEPMLPQVVGGLAVAAIGEKAAVNPREQLRKV